jgi:hypothetical protein
MNPGFDWQLATGNWQLFTGGSVLSMMLVISLVLGILPLLGVVWTLMNGMITTVDGLFMSLILLTLSGIFLLNAYWEMRDLGMLGEKTPGKKAAAPADKSPATKAS